jgi:hypothetical protein
MLHPFRRKEELRAEMALDRTFELVNLRECLKFLRDNKTQSAADIMEIRLDGAVVSIARDLDHCKPSTKDVIACELKKLWLYRKESPGRSGSWLDGCDSTTREGLLRIRAEAERILNTYRTPDT